MKPVILLGAGFSRNWGGWLAVEAMEYLLGCQEVMDSVPLKQLLWKHQKGGTGFEGALDELQTPARGQTAQRQGLESAVRRMFAAMNTAFIERIEFNCSNQRERQLTTFLTRFGALFSLNQDLLLERHYCNDNVMLSGVGWNGPSLPGLDRAPSVEPMHRGCWARSVWKPRPTADFALDRGYQPIFKLHGSSNWQSRDGDSMLVIGGGKEQAIARHPILAWYAKQFETYLMQPGARLMVIGYGFRDEHINQMLWRAVAGGLQIFVIAPEGTSIAFAQSSGHIVDPSAAEKGLKEALIGASRRPLSETFSDAGDAEFSKVMRFFAS